MRRGWLALLRGLACGGSGEVVAVELPPPHDPDVACGRSSDARTSCVGLVWRREIDVLFVIDDGVDAGGLQTRLADAMPRLVERIAAMDPAPSLRIAFTSSRDGNSTCAPHDGSAGRLLLASCRERPTAFALADGSDRWWELCASRCAIEALATTPTMIEGSDVAKPRPWIEIEGARTNLAVPLADALQCAAPLGVAGCPFASPLRATWYAFQRTWQDGDQPEVGFFRESAVPLVVWVTSGIECSLGAAGEAAFDPEGSRALWTDPDAATPGLCWRAGVSCTRPDADGTMTCTARDIDEAGAPSRGGATVLQRIEEVAELLEGVAEWRSLALGELALPIVAITGVMGDPSYPMTAHAADDDEMRAQYGIAPSCELDGDPLFPPVRLAAFAETDVDEWFGNVDTALLSACTDDFAPALEHVADRIAELAPPMCMPFCVADVDDELPGLQVDCSLRAEIPAPPHLDHEDIGPCDRDASGTPAIPPDASGCFVARTDDALAPACAEQGFNLELALVWRGGAVPPGTVFLPRCELSEDRAHDCARD